MPEFSNNEPKPIWGRIAALKDRFLSRFKKEPKSITGLVYFLDKDEVDGLRIQLVSNQKSDINTQQKTQELALLISAKFTLPPRNKWVLETQHLRTIGGVSRDDFHQFTYLWKNELIPKGNDSKGYIYGEFLPQGHLIIIPELSYKDLLKQNIIEFVKGKGHSDAVQTIKEFWLEKTIIEELFHAAASKKLFTAEAKKWTEAGIKYYTSAFISDKYKFDLTFPSEEKESQLWKKVVAKYGKVKARELFFDDNLDFALLDNAVK